MRQNWILCAAILCFRFAAFGQSSSLSLSTTALARGTSGQPYLFSLAATGGTPPYSFDLTGLFLEGLILETRSGQMSGIPRFARCCTVTVSVTDTAGGNVTRTVPFIVDPPIAILGQRYGPFNYRNTGQPPYGCEIISGALPPGLPLSANCTLSGIANTNGSFNFLFRITSSDNIQTVLDQTISVRSRVELMLLSQSGFTVVSQSGSRTPRQRSFRVLNIGEGSLNWSARAITTSGGEWLSVSPASGTSTGGPTGQSPGVTLTANPDRLPPGDYYGQVELSAPQVTNSPQTVTIVLSVSAASAQPSPDVSPRGMTFAGVAGGSNPAPQTVTISNPGATPLPFTATARPDGPAWFTASPVSGTVAPDQSAVISVRPVLAGLAAQVYTGTLSLVLGGQAPIPVALQLIVTGSTPAAVSERTGSVRSADCQATRLLPVFTTVGAGLSAVTAWPTPIETSVVDDCAIPSTDGSVLVTFSNNDPPLALISQRDGNWSGTWTPRSSAASGVTLTLTARNLAGNLSGTARFGGGVQTNPNPPPLVASGGVLSAATFERFAPLAPGSIISAFGTKLAPETSVASTLPLPVKLAETDLLVGGAKAALLFVSEGQINAMLPFELPVATPLQMVVRRGGALSVPETLILATSQPGVFTKTQNGVGQGIVVGARATGETFVNGPDNPLRAGDVMVIYSAGLGFVDQPVNTGDASPSNPLARTLNSVAVTVGSIPCQVLFAGLSPGFAGLYQINAVLREGVPKGTQVPLTITAGGQSSPPVTLHIE